MVVSMQFAVKAASRAFFAEEIQSGFDHNFGWERGTLDFGTMPKPGCPFPEQETTKTI